MGSGRRGWRWSGSGPSEGWHVCTRAYGCRAAQSSRGSSAPRGGYRPLLKCSPSSLPPDSRPSNASSLATSHSPAQPRASERASERGAAALRRECGWIAADAARCRMDVALTRVLITVIRVLIILTRVLIILTRVLIILRTMPAIGWSLSASPNHTSPEQYLRYSASAREPK